MRNLKPLVVLLFLVILPVTAVWFSKRGLDTYRTMRSEMRLLPDSIAAPELNLRTHRGVPVDTSYTKGKMYLVHVTAGTMEQAGSQTVLSVLQPVQRQFNKEDAGRYRIFTLTADSSAVEAQIARHGLDSLNWKFLPVAEQNIAEWQARFRLQQADQVALVNSKGYLCDVYALNDSAALERLKAHMALVIPKKDRKRYQYRPDEDPYE